MAHEARFNTNMLKIRGYFNNNSRKLFNPEGATCVRNAAPVMSSASIRPSGTCELWSEQNLLENAMRAMRRALNYPESMTRYQTHKAAIPKDRQGVFVWCSHAHLGFVDFFFHCSETRPWKRKSLHSRALGGHGCGPRRYLLLRILLRNFVGNNVWFFHVDFGINSGRGNRIFNWNIWISWCSNATAFKILLRLFSSRHYRILLRKSKLKNC